MSIKEKLQKALSSFNLESALALSDEIHNLECAGVELTRSEERLWERLTYNIEQQRNK